MNDMRIEAEIGVGTGSARREIEGLKGSIRELNSQLEASSNNLQEQAKVAQQLALAVQRLEAAELSYAKTVQTTSQTALRERQQEIRETENLAAANIKLAAAKRQAGLSDPNPGLATRLPTNYLPGRAVGLSSKQDDIDADFGNQRIAEVNRVNAAVRTAELSALRERIQARYAAEIAGDKMISSARVSQAQQTNRQLIVDEQNLDRNRIAANRARAESVFGLPDVGALNQTRYALYDVATTLGVFGTAATAAGVATVAFAAQYESAFTAVERTAPQASVAQLEELRQGLFELSEAIPVGFESLAEIATLGSQLGIEPDDLEAFTETVARFAAVTGIATDQVAQDFGALGELLDVPATSFENLASAINFTGINSVATDKEILALATNIGASATQAGFAAEETVGLASALASLRIQPEQARGVILRLFGDIDKAVSEGGESIEGYARVMDSTTESAESLWKTDPEQFFSSFIQGLERARNGAGDLNQTLTDLGIVETRERNVLQRLAGNYEVYTGAIGDANQAYLEGTFLGDSYAKTQDDIATRITILVNSVQNLLAQMGEAIAPIIGPIVDIIAAIVQTIGNLPAPVLGAISAVTLLAGGFTLLVAGGAALVASGFAVQTALAGLTRSATGTLSVSQGLRATIQQLTSAMGLNTAAARIQSVTLGSLGSTMRGAAAGTSAAAAATTASSAALTGGATAARGFSAALLGIPVVNILAGLSLAVPVLLAIADGMNQSTQAATQAGKDFVAAGGGLDVFRAALEADTEAAANGARSFGELTVETQKLSSEEERAAAAKVDHTNSVLDFIDADEQVRAGLRQTNDALAEQTYQLGQNTLEFYKNAAAKTINEGDFTADDLNTAQSLGFDFETAFERSGTEGGATAYFQEIKKAIEESIIAVDEFGNYVETNVTRGQYEGALSAIEEITLGLDNSRAALELNEAAATLLGTGIETVGEEGEVAADRLSGIKDAIEGAFAGLTNEADFSNAIQNLNDSLSETGFVFNTVSEEGRANLSLLEGALSSAAVYGDQLGLTTEESMAQAFASVAGSGEDISNLLQFLASQPVEFTANLNVAGVIEAYNSLSSVTGNMIQGPVQLAGLVSEQYRQARAEATAANKATRGAGRAQKSNNDAQKRFNEKRLELEEKITEAQRIQYETTLEYANAIGGIVSRATSLRFDRDNGLDDIASQWQTIRDRQLEARDAIRDYRAELIALNAERNQQTYFLSVAVEYGDSLRGDAIRGQIAGIDKEIADANKGIKESQNAASTSLTGNSEAARNNRAEVQNLASSYTDLIQKYADSGLTTDQLATKTEELRQDFIKQGTQLGYSRDELGKYEQSFYDVRDAIATVPRNITVSANVNPAIQAMNEFRNKTDERVRQARKSLEDHIRAGVQNARNSAAGGVSVPVRVDNSALEKFGRGMELVRQAASWQWLMNNTMRNGGSGNHERGKMEEINRRLTSGNYYRGGVIGGGGRPTNRGVDDTLIMAQLGEGVVTQKSMEWLGSDGLDAINQQRNPFGSQAVVNASLDFDGIMELGPATLNALVNAFEARGLTVQMDGVTVGRVIEKANVKRRNYGD